MASEAQIKANRANAVKSTGPKTAEGRAKSRMNALKYGLTAKQLIIFDENQKDLSDLLSDMFEDYQPVGAREEELTRQLALAFWGLRRIRRAEAGIYNDAGDHRCGVFQTMTSAVANHTRSLAATLRSIQTFTNELERLQARRRREVVQPPIAIEVSGTVEIPPASAAAVTPEAASASPRAARRQQQVPDSQIVLDFEPREVDGRTSDPLLAADPQLTAGPSLQNEPNQPLEPCSEKCKTKPISADQLSADVRGDTGLAVETTNDSAGADPEFSARDYAKPQSRAMCNPAGTAGKDRGPLVRSLPRPASAPAR
jgi:hypothetical protein